MKLRWICATLALLAVSNAEVADRRHPLPRTFEVGKLEKYGAGWSDDHRYSRVTREVETLSKNGNISKALKTLDVEVKQRPTNLLHLWIKVDLSGRLGVESLRSSTEEAENLLDESPGPVADLFYAGSLFRFYQANNQDLSEDFQRYKKGKNALLRASKADFKSDLVGTLWLADLLDTWDEPFRARQVVEKYLARNPSAYGVRNRLCGLYSGGNITHAVPGGGSSRPRPDLVLAHAKVLMSQKPDFAPAQYWTGLAYFDQKQYQAAKQHLTKYKSMIPKDDPGHKLADHLFRYIPE